MLGLPYTLGLSLVAGDYFLLLVCGLLIVVVSPVPEHGLRCSGSVVVVCRLSSFGTLA